MSQRFRIAEGGRIDRETRLSFRYDGHTYDGFGGDTLASALLANGVHLTGRSFKYHRPRGILSSWFRRTERAGYHWNGRPRNAQPSRDTGRAL